MNLPIIAITAGDMAGIGPEILLKALVDPRVGACCRPLGIADYAVLQKTENEVAKTNLKMRQIGSFEEADFSNDAVNILNMPCIPIESFHKGEPDAVTGRAMLDFTTEAVNLALAGKVHGAVGGPHSKKAADEAGYNFIGYPMMIAEMTGRKYPFLLLASERIKVANVTLHTSLRKALDMLSVDLVLECIKATEEGMRTFGIAKPKLAVAGLNPHAGENRMFGDEDEDIIKPAVEQAKTLGIDVEGPFPADSLFYNTENRPYHAYVGMYHDQAHIPVKVLSFKSASAVGLGIPVNWATVDHGCALDIAWKGLADEQVLVETICLIAKRAAYYRS
ncbi:MAG: 4-hydroxythreonine-4-phosphate dehydrogenase PdxA [Desulfovibrionaceae bacterium]|nr:4-hydroxythreonine-4-phosphate dehydrogenase PdxA [Desulfovibrionaceae bacterium]